MWRAGRRGVNKKKKRVGCHPDRASTQRLCMNACMQGNAPGPPAGTWAHVVSPLLPASQAYARPGGAASYSLRPARRPAAGHSYGWARKKSTGVTHCGQLQPGYKTSAAAMHACMPCAAHTHSLRCCCGNTIHRGTCMYALHTWCRNEVPHAVFFVCKPLYDGGSRESPAAVHQLLLHHCTAGSKRYTCCS